jgi:hypothetical protein
MEPQLYMQKVNCKNGTCLFDYFPNAKSSSKKSFYFANLIAFLFVQVTKGKHLENVKYLAIFFLQISKH